MMINPHEVDHQLCPPQHTAPHGQKEEEEEVGQPANLRSSRRHRGQLSLSASVRRRGRNAASAVPDYGALLLGSSSLADRIQTGSIWMFSEFELPLRASNCTAKRVCDSPVTSGAFVTSDRVINFLALRRRFPL
ncbi:unnamed protein product [Nesidiocoris tenuis]|uniref:Uncharacterized protein n=1 Tax=Nesidiocoris tenuis TaxID=355587 RepID=A0A6H5G5V4_9HEMI|nr:unnamed protein product [Nesidiocoris tenuis]